MKYKVYDVGESIQIDIHSPGSDEKIEEYVLPKNTLDMFMLLIFFWTWLLEHVRASCKFVCFYVNA